MSLLLSGTTLQFGDTVTSTSKLTFTNSQQAHVAASNSHLVLSGNFGSIIAMSGALKMHQVANTASLPANSVATSGSVLYVNDIKCFVGYSAEGWTRFLTGAL
jgi:hypothetical protein